MPKLKYLTPVKIMGGMGVTKGDQTCIGEIGYDNHKMHLQMLQQLGFQNWETSAVMVAEFWEKHENRLLQQMSVKILMNKYKQQSANFQQITEACTEQNAGKENLYIVWQVVLITQHIAQYSSKS